MGQTPGKEPWWEPCWEPPHIAQGSHLSPALTLGPATAGTSMNVTAQSREPCLGIEGVSSTPRGRKPFEILGLHP